MKVGFKVTKDTITPKLSSFPEDVQSEVRARFPNVGRQLVGTSRSIVAVISGRLRASIGYEVRGGTTVSLYADTPYAAIQEKRKPYLRPALERNTQFIIAEYTDAIIKAMLR